MATDVRTAHPDELSAWLSVLTTAFLDSNVDTQAMAAEVTQLWDLSRAWAAVEDGVIVGTTRTWASELTLPGRERLPASAVAAVAVRPTHRRRGIMRGMLDAEHAAARERGEAVALLYAAEYPIYGRFGYGPASPIATWTLDTRRSAFHRTATGTVEYVEPASARDEMIRVHETWRVSQPGDIRRRDYGWDFDLNLRPPLWGDPWKGFIAFHRDVAGRVDGYVRYHAKGKWERGQPDGEVTVDDLQALNDDAYDALWQFLASIDLATTVKATGRRPLERLPWLLTNARAAQSSEPFDGLWVKLLDPAKALAARAYERSARLVIEIVDAATPAHGGNRFALDATPDGATCAATTESADLTIAAGALRAAFLGGTPLRHAVLAQGADEHRSGALGDADALFRTLDPPWCSTFF